MFYVCSESHFHQPDISRESRLFTNRLQPTTYKNQYRSNLVIVKVLCSRSAPPQCTSSPPRKLYCYLLPPISLFFILQSLHTVPANIVPSLTCNYVVQSTETPFTMITGELCATCVYSVKSKYVAALLFLVLILSLGVLLFCD